MFLHLCEAYFFQKSKKEIDKLFLVTKQIIVAHKNDVFDYKKASNLEMILKILIYENNKFMMAFRMVMKI